MGTMKKGIREKEALIRIKLQGRKAITHHEKTVSHLMENEMLSPLWFHFMFPTHLCTSEGSSHMKGIHQHSLSLL
jgi:competence transcription factor ComK